MSIFTESRSTAPFALKDSAQAGTGDSAFTVAAPANSDSSPLPDRREARRFKTAFRPGCVVVGNRVLLGMIRNMSKDGVMIEIDKPLRIGQRVAYFWDEKSLVPAKVAWSEGNRHGLENDDEATIFDTRFSYRSVRVPCTLDAEIWVSGNRHRVEVANLSLGGMRVRGLGDVARRPLTICMAGMEIYNAEIRWTRGGESGIRFTDRLTQSQLAAVLGHDSVSFDSIAFN